jgi:nickel-dependent lactate racemase
MRVVVDFQDESLVFELPEERVVAAWNGPEGIDRASLADALSSALEQPWDYPPLRQLVVPGDRVVIAFDTTIPDSEAVLGAVVGGLEAGGVDRADVTVLSASPVNTGMERALPPGTVLAAHDPDDRSQMAYLATTKQGRRVYLNRLLTDADVVVPVGRLGFDPVLGYRGPWSVLFPASSDRETMQTLRSESRAPGDDATEGRARACLDESFEVSWLLGAQFHVGLAAGASGVAEAIAGRESLVRERGIAAVDRLWKFHVDSRAELVVAGIGRPGNATTLEDLAEGLATATRLVQHGGKIVVLSRANGAIGPALHRLIGAVDPKEGVSVLRGHEGDSDILIARRLTHALSWADVFLHSALSPEIVDDLSLFSLEHPEQARRLVAKSGSCVFVSQAELTRAVVLPENVKS